MNNYFPHDSNSRNSDKLLPVRMKYGAEGYGIYFMILERLRDEKNYMSVKDYNMLAFDLRVDAGKVKSIVEEFGLFAFTDNGECFYSEGFNKRMEIKDEKSKKRSEAGKKGAAKRWQKDSDANDKEIALPSSDHSKESKGNQSKLNKTKYTASSSTDHISDNTAVAYWLNQVNPTEAPMILESIGFWVKDFNGQDEIVITAIDEMLKNDARSFKYLERVLKSWESKGLDTVEKVQKYLDGHYSKKGSKKSGGKWTDKTLWDYWWADRMAGNPSVNDFSLKKNLSDSEMLRLIQIIREKGYEGEIS